MTCIRCKQQDSAHLNTCDRMAVLVARSADGREFERQAQRQAWARRDAQSTSQAWQVDESTGKIVYR